TQYPQPLALLRPIGAAADVDFGCPTFTTCHTPPKVAKPSPYASSASWSCEKRYSGSPPAVTTRVPSDKEAVPRVPAPGPAVGAAPDDAVRGGQTAAHAPVQSTVLPLLVRV